MDETYAIVSYVLLLPSLGYSFNQWAGLNTMVNRAYTMAAVSVLWVHYELNYHKSQCSLPALVITNKILVPSFDKIQSGRGMTRSAASEFEPTYTQAILMFEMYPL